MARNQKNGKSDVGAEEGSGRFKHGEVSVPPEALEAGIHADVANEELSNQEEPGRMGHASSKARLRASESGSSGRGNRPLLNAAGLKQKSVKPTASESTGDLSQLTDVFAATAKTDSDSLKDRRIAAELHHFARIDDPDSLFRCTKRNGVNIRSTGGRTVDEENKHPLHIAAAFGCKRCVHALLEQGVDPNVLDLYSQTPLDLAELRGMQETSQYLASAGGRRGLAGSLGSSGGVGSTSHGSRLSRGVSLQAGGHLPDGNALAGAAGISFGGVTVSSHWSISSEHIFIGTRIGEGSFGTVYQCNWHGSRCALKTLKADYQRDSVAMKELERELSVWTRITHPNICTLWGVVKTEELPLAFVSEYVSGGSLKDLISKDEEPILQQRALGFTRQLASALAYLHNRTPLAVIHRDVKPENCLLTTNEIVKLADFGLSRLLHVTEKSAENQRQLTGETGAFRYMSPENLTSRPYNVKTDVYSAAIIMYELMEGPAQISANGRIEKHPQTIAQRAAEGYRPSFARLSVSSKLRSRKIRETICAAWEQDVASRINSRSLLSRVEDILNTPASAFDGSASEGNAKSAAQPKCCVQ